MDNLENKSWGELLAMRGLPENQSRERQAFLAPLEHRAYARETVRQNPIDAIALGVATPAYTLAKLFGLHPSRSPASLGEILAGYQGIGEGLAGAAEDWWKK